LPIGKERLVEEKKFVEKGRLGKRRKKATFGQVPGKRRESIITIQAWVKAEGFGVKLMELGGNQGGEHPKKTKPSPFSGKARAAAICMKTPKRSEHFPPKPKWGKNWKEGTPPQKLSTTYHATTTP